MSSSKVQPSLPRLSALAAEMRPEWFPEGRNPWCDLYKADVVANIGKIIGLTSEKELDRLGIALCEATERYIVVADEVALEMRDSDRARWIEKNMIKPAERLRECLSTAENGRVWSKWPDEQFDPSGPNVDRWSQALAELIDWAKDRHAWLRFRPHPRTKPMTDCKYALVKLYVRFTGEHPTRIAYPEDKKLRIKTGARRRHKTRGSIESKAVGFVRAAAQPILGTREDLLDDQIKVAIEKGKLMKNTPRR